MKIKSFKEFINETTNTICTLLSGCILNEDAKKYNPVKVCAEFVDSLNELKTSVLNLSNLNFFNKQYTEKMFNADVKNTDDVITLFNNLTKIIVDIHNTVKLYNNPKTTLDKTITHDILMKYKAYNLYVEVINHFILKFSSILKLTGENCVLMEIKNDVHNWIVIGTLKLEPINLTQFTILEDATLAIDNVVHS